MKAAAWGLVVAATVGCSVSTRNVFHGPGRVRNPGYSVDYVEASPEPGTGLHVGARVRFEVKVRYTLLRTARGRLLVQLLDGHGQLLQDALVAAVDVVRTGAEKTAVLAGEAEIPRSRSDLVVSVLLVPEGEPAPVGDLRIRYLAVEER